MDELTEIELNTRSILDVPVKLVPFRREESPTEDPGITLRSLSVNLRTSLDNSLFLNRASVVAGRKYEASPSWIIRFESEGPTISRRTNCEDGEPYLAIRYEYTENKLSAEIIWDLYLNGPRTIKLGEANTQDTDGIAQLAESAYDSAALLSMAALISPELAGTLSAKLRVRNMSQARELPTMTGQKVRSLLLDAGLGRTDTGKAWTGPRTATLNIKSGKTTATVAIGVRPSAYELSRPLTSAEQKEIAAAVEYSNSVTRGGKSVYEKGEHAVRRRIEGVLQKEFQKNWSDAADKVLTSAGWVEVLEEDKHNSVVMDSYARWYTLIDEPTWATIEPFARPSLRTTSFQRTGPF